MLLLAGRDEPANDLLRVYELVFLQLFYFILFLSRARNSISHSVRRLISLSVSLSVSLSLKTRSTRLMAIGLVSISDTDSLYISYQRPLMALEQVERSLLEKQEEISYSNSLTAQLLSSAYIKSLGEL